SAEKIIYTERARSYASASATQIGSLHRLGDDWRYRRSSGPGVGGVVSPGPLPSLAAEQFQGVGPVVHRDDAVRRGDDAEQVTRAVLDQRLGAELASGRGDLDGVAVVAVHHDQVTVGCQGHAQRSVEGAASRQE